MYKRQREKVQTSYSLFIKIFIVMCVSIVLISFLSTFITMRVSERLFLDTFSITNKNIIDHVEQNLDTYGYSVSMTVNRIQQNKAVYDFTSAQSLDSLEASSVYYEIHEQLNMIETSLGQMPSNIIVTGESNRKHSTNYAYWDVKLEDLNQSFITNYAKQTPNYISYHYVNSKLTNNEGMIIAVKALKEPSSSYIYGYTYIGIKEEDFRSMYKNYTRDGNDFLLIDNNGRVVSSNREEWIGNRELSLLSQAKMIDDSHEEFENIHWNDQEYLLASKYLSIYDMYLVNVIDRDSLKESLTNPKAVFLISFIIVIIALMIVFLITRKMTKSLSNLVKEIAYLSKNNFGQKVTVDGSYETRELATTFNNMLDELHIYVDKLLETERKQRHSELAALQRQINPHFLYNTLTSIKILVERGETEKSTAMIHSLISLLQSTIGNISEMVTVEEEMASMEHYVYINQIRYGERIKVNYFVTPDCLQFELPKLIIQPFVENAFFHAFNQTYEGTIQILIAKENNMLICEVVDNGDGMEIDVKNRPKQKNKRQLFSGIGVKNVHERIVLLYGEQYGIKIESELGKGTRIIMKLPLIKNGEIVDS